MNARNAFGAHRFDVIGGLLDLRRAGELDGGTATSFARLHHSYPREQPFDRGPAAPWRRERAPKPKPHLAPVTARKAGLADRGRRTNRLEPARRP